MKRLASILLLIGALGFVAGLPLAMLPGCAARQQTAEVASYNSIRASDAAVEAAIRAWSVRFADREARNEATRSTDPGGYLQRQSDLLREHGRVVALHGAYSDAVRATVNAWVAAKQAGKPAPIEPLQGPDVTALKFQLEEATK